LHPQAREALSSRVMMTSGGRPLVRTSRVLSLREERDARGQRIVGLWLSVDLAGPEAKDDDEELFELLVLSEEKAPKPAAAALLRGRLLLQTTRDWQLHIKSKDPRRLDMAAEALGRDQLFRCSVCNYQVGSPSEGSWVVIARPSFLSGCIEAVDVFSLEDDLAMELSVHPFGPHRHGDLRAWLERCAQEMAQGLGAREPATLGTSVPAKIGGLAGWTRTMQLTLPGGVQRAFELHALQHGDATYLVSIQADPSTLETKGHLAQELRETFMVLRPGEPVRKETLLEVFGGPGKFSEDGTAYTIETLGVHMPGFADWKQERRIGVGAFHACWIEKKSGSTLRIVGVERPHGNWSGRAVLRYLAQLVDSNKGHASARPGFRVLGKLRRSELGKHRSYQLDFEYVVPNLGETARCRGFLHAIPLGQTLLLLAGESMPGEGQEPRLEEMLRKAKAVEIR
jgi:hypothetical protein